MGGSVEYVFKKPTSALKWMELGVGIICFALDTHFNAARTAGIDYGLMRFDDNADTALRLAYVTAVAFTVIFPPMIIISMIHNPEAFYRTLIGPLFALVAAPLFLATGAMCVSADNENLAYRVPGIQAFGGMCVFNGVIYTIDLIMELYRTIVSDKMH